MGRCDRSPLCHQGWYSPCSARGGNRGRDDRIQARERQIYRMDKDGWTSVWWGDIKSNSKRKAAIVYRSLSAKIGESFSNQARLRADSHPIPASGWYRGWTSRWNPDGWKSSLPYTTHKVRWRWKLLWSRCLSTNPIERGYAWRQDYRVSEWWGKTQSSLHLQRQGSAEWLQRERLSGIRMQESA